MNIKNNIPDCPICNTKINTFNTNTKSWAKTCSPECGRIFRYDGVDVSEEQVHNIINALPNDFNYRLFIGKFPREFKKIKQMTIDLPTTYQIRKRIQWLKGEIKTRKEINEEQKLNIIDNAPKCWNCKNKCIPFKSGKKGYYKWCSVDCKQKYKKQQHIKKLIRSLKKIASCKRNYAPWNKRIDQQLNCKEWLITQHIKNQLTKQQIANLCNVDKETITNRFKLFNIKSIRHPFNAAEKEIYTFLNEIYNDGGVIELNTRQIISPQELDFFIPSQNIAIEYCGLYWHADIHKRINKTYHQQKYQMCSERNIRLLTIFEDEWLHKKEIVKDKISHILHQSTADVVYARNTNIITNSTPLMKRSFFNTHHIQGNGSGSITITLIFNETPVAMMTFIQLKNKEFMLNRFATSCRVIGGFSKLLKFFKQNNDWNKITTFADLRWSGGDLYENEGFILDKIIPPDYSYINSNNCTRIHKFNYRRKNLSKLLKNFDPNLSERQNCDNNGVLRIWDCGKIRFVLTNQI